MTTTTETMLETITLQCPDCSNLCSVWGTPWSAKRQTVAHCACGKPWDFPLEAKLNY